MNYQRPQDDGRGRLWMIRGSWIHTESSTVARVRRTISSTT